MSSSPESKEQVIEGCLEGMRGAVKFVVMFDDGKATRTHVFNGSNGDMLMWAHILRRISERRLEPEMITEAMVHQGGGSVQ